MRAVLGNEAELAFAIAEQHQILAEQAHARVHARFELDRPPRSAASSGAGASPWAFPARRV
jgi:hypothetical protein